MANTRHRVWPDDLAAVLGDHQGLALDDVVEPRQLRRIHQVGLVEDEHVPIPRSDRQRSVDELGLALDQDELTDQGVQFHAPVARYRLHRPVEPAGNLIDQTRLARAGGTGQEHPIPVGPVQVSQDVPQQRVAEHVGLPDGDQRIVLVVEADDFQARLGLDAKGLGHIEACFLHGVSPGLLNPRRHTSPGGERRSPRGLAWRVAVVV